MGVIPEILYKYLPPERIGFENGKGFFPNLEVSFTAPVEFNDPFDCALYINTTTKDYTDYLNSNENFNYTKSKLEQNLGKKVSESCVKIFIRKSKKKFKERRDKKDYISELGKEAWEISTKANIRILSLSKNYNNLLMWSHYAKNHKGFVVGIKSAYFESEIFSNLNKDIWGLKNVIYEDKLPEFNPWKNPIPTQSKLLSFFKKSKCWEYEEEVRFVGYMEEKCLNFHIEKIPNNYIESIRLGAKITDEDKTKIVNFCRESLPNVSIYQAQLQKEFYDLEFIPISSSQYDIK